MSVALIIIVVLVIAAVTGVKVYVDNQEINKEKSTTIVTPNTVSPVEVTEEKPAEVVIEPVAEVAPVVSAEPVIDAAPKADAPVKKAKKRRYYGKPKPKTKTQA